MHITPFHLAIPVTSLDNARRFYGDLLGCKQGRSSHIWIDWNFFGHQLVTHRVEQPGLVENRRPSFNEVDTKSVPVPHFGIVTEMHSWKSLAEKLTAANVDFVIAPYVRFKGEPGEQATFFLCDYCGNALEFKAFANMKSLFEA